VVPAIVDQEAIDLVGIPHEEQSLLKKLFEKDTADRMQ